MSTDPDMDLIENTRPLDVLACRVWSGTHWHYPHIEKMCAELSRLRAPALRAKELERELDKERDDCLSALADARGLSERVKELEKELFEAHMHNRGTFWKCLKCGRITHSWKCVHRCECGNWPSSGFFTSGTFERWQLQNPDAFDKWQSARNALTTPDTEPSCPASPTPTEPGR